VTRRTPDRTVAELLAELRPDPWRLESGFSPEIAAANARLLEAGVSEDLAIHILNEWLQRYQPCLFGRIAAKQGLISYCVLTESDLQQEDEAIRTKIQEARTRWTRDGFEGRKSGFVILAISSTIAFAVPNQHMRAFAQKLCSLYLLEPIDTERIYMDETFLEIPGRERSTWRWHAGVNYFCAQGDKRWWQDHRVPGGMAFSINSVGHMAKSGRLALAMRDLNDVLEIPSQAGTTPKIESLPTALEFAMRTIAIASNAVSGKATELMRLPADPAELPIRKCPVDLPAFLKDKNFCSYRGFYHTDYTLPSEYFLSDVERPHWVKPHQLDFTYLFAEEGDNPDFVTMGSGRRVRRIDGAAEPVNAARRSSKATAEELPIDGSERLVRALGR
jgi:hypothetical protein